KRVDFDRMADVYVINTCTVTNTGDKKSRQVIRRAVRKNPEAVVCVTGCYAQTSPGEIMEIPGVDRSEEHTSELQSRFDLVCRLLLGKKKDITEIQSRCVLGCPHPLVNKRLPTRCPEVSEEGYQRVQLEGLVDSHNRKCWDGACKT